MSTVIKVENIGKQYRLGKVGTGTIGHDINRWWHTFRGKEDPYLKIGEANERSIKGDSDYVWALKDINFQVAQGEVLGIIGRNGAGKSTLLKILSRTTAPSEGTIKIKGRVASLLEVGTGFHPELTGRENVFLNGAILGMTKKEIKAKFDEIVDFAGVERYIDTPVKRYSSGMYVRLAFGVAAHLEPEILIVDEVLAVGDAEFQKKALGKMKAVSHNEGRTVLFVSHNMAAVKSLCTAGVVMRSGRLEFSGSQVEAINYYQSVNNANDTYLFSDSNIQLAHGNHDIRVLEFRVEPSSGKTISISSGFEFRIRFYNYKPNINLDATFELRTVDEVPVFHHGALISTSNDSKIGIYTVVGKIPPFYLNAGSYKFSLIFGENQRYALYTHEDIIQFEVANESLGSNSNRIPGIMRPHINYQINWQTENDI
jgi:lipopolysaccharide transport system ATP-binding protein